MVKFGENRIVLKKMTGAATAEGRRPIAVARVSTIDRRCWMAWRDYFFQV
jgi:hypothetical protein